MHVMVVGGNGFLGAHIVRQLVAEEHRVSVFDISPINQLNDDIAAKFEHVQGDVTDPADVDHGTEPSAESRLRRNVARPIGGLDPAGCNRWGRLRI